MSKRIVDWSTATPEQVEKSLRVWKLRFTIAAVQYVVVIGIAFWVGSAVVGAITIGVGLVGLPLGWRHVRAKHGALRAKVPTGGSV